MPATVLWNVPLRGSLNSVFLDKYNSIIDCWSRPRTVPIEHSFSHSVCYISCHCEQPWYNLKGKITSFGSQFQGVLSTWSFTSISQACCETEYSGGRNVWQRSSFVIDRKQRIRGTLSLSFLLFTCIFNNGCPSNYWCIISLSKSVNTLIDILWIFAFQFSEVTITQLN